MCIIEGENMDIRDSQRKWVAIATKNGYMMIIYHEEKGSKHLNKQNVRQLRNDNQLSECKHVA